MFNGIIFNQGSVHKVAKRPRGINLFVKSDLKLTNKDMGVSVALDGVCLTLISISSKYLGQCHENSQRLLDTKYS